MNNELQQLGLSLNESRIYTALLELKEAGVGKISSRTKIHRRNVYDTMHRLIDKGLVFPILSKGEHLFSPVDPDKLMELVKEKEVILQGILPELRNRYEKRKSGQEAYIYRGTEGIKNYMRDILRTGKDVYSIGGKLNWFDSKLITFTEQFLKETKRKNIKFHTIFDGSVNNKDALKIINKSGGSYKFLPTNYSTASAIDIFGDYVVTYTGLSYKKINKNVTIFVLKDESLAESYKTWFKFMFDKCQKPKGRKK